MEQWIMVHIQYHKSHLMHVFDAITNLSALCNKMSLCPYVCTNQTGGLMLNFVLLLLPFVLSPLVCSHHNLEL
jgi:hypothetical protein